MIKNIQVLLNGNKTYEVVNLDEVKILEDECNATLIEVTFPTEYEEFSKRVDFMNPRGEKWTTSLYAPEDENNQYDGNFDKLNFGFTIPNAMAKRGELLIQFVAYLADGSGTTVPFQVMVATINRSILYATCQGKENPELIIKAYEYSNTALELSREALEKTSNSERAAIESENSAKSAEESAKEALIRAENAEESAKDSNIRAVNAEQSALNSEQSAANAEESARLADERATTAEQVSSEANQKSDNAVVTSNEANEKSTIALDIIENLTVSSEEIDCTEHISVEIQTNLDTNRKNIHFNVPAPKQGKSYRNCGVWNSTTEYLNDEYYIDTISLHGCTYYCKVTNTNQEPSESQDNDYWGLLAIKGSDAGVTIEDNLESNNADHVLSAKQGKVLKELIASSVETAITNLINNAPDSLNTLSELATAIENDPQFATTIKALISANATNISSNTSEITNIKNGTTIVPKAYGVVETDTRSVNSTPAEYMAQGYNGVKYEFKQNNVIGLTASGVGTYSDIMVCVPWQDSTGGYPLQIAFNSGGIYYRVGTSNTTWGSWCKITNQTELESNVATLNNSIATKEALSVYSATFLASTTTTGTAIVHTTNNKMYVECYFSINLTNAISQNSNTTCTITISGLDTSGYSSGSMLTSLLTQGSAAVTNDYMNSQCAIAGSVTKGTSTTATVTIRRAYSEQNVWCHLYTAMIFQ